MKQEAIGHWSGKAYSSLNSGESAESASSLGERTVPGLVSPERYILLARRHTQ